MYRNIKLEKMMIDLGMDEKIPTAHQLWQTSNQFLIKGDLKNAKLYENLNHFLHNSSIPASAKIGKNVNFGYGGIGIIIHKDCTVGDYVTIGSSVTLGGRTGSNVHYIDTFGKKKKVPKIGDYCYLATGSKILGGVEIGGCSIIGANAVVLDHVPPCSVVVGSPGKIIATIHPENIQKYKNNFTRFRSMNDEEIISILQSFSTDVGNNDA